ncbi:aerobic C4-dicarboxylate transport protein [Parapedobacter composti]|uniref:Aerobic C4-dicarboxylate transport protein n=1 Tax=Parapedobacter composti TaxID=623281 RepID=A0A1I1FPG8_9SPHI|nr:C4-dicarboxylate transporter DctA [Parapedobacter composti]SFB99508.1 aerobic C4-dicarboxylate transport protein [Parapedobacter composti]
MRKLFSLLYFQVIIAIIIGVLIGHFYPSLGVQLKPLGDGFIKMIKMVIAPLIFCSIVLGIAGMEDVKKIGKVGVKALLWFQVSTTIAMVLGIVVINIVKPGAGMHVDADALDTTEVAGYIDQSNRGSGIKDFLLNIIPENVFGALSSGDLLQVLFFAVLFGYGLSKIGTKAEPAMRVMQSFLDGLFAVIKMIMKVAPIGAMGAMGFTIGKYGIGSLSSLGMLMVTFYVTCLLYIFLALGLVLKYHGISIFKLVRYIKEELLVVLGTSSSESVLPAIMQKLEQMGCSRPVVRLTIPTGYSFNLDGTTIYLTMAAIFLSQALDMPMDLGEQLFLLFVLTITSNGAAGVTGSGFIILAATLPVVGHMPVESVALIFGIDRFMSEARALTNLIGNTAATLVVARWENELDMQQLESELGD